MNLKYDMHLSAYEISRWSVLQVESLGFVRDEFANNTRCEATSYHGTYRGDTQLPNDSLWVALCNMLDKDEIFVGALEEEACDTNAIMSFVGTGSNTKLLLPPMQTIQPPPGVFKACDIHLRLNIQDSIPARVKLLESLQMASFDRPYNGKVHRVFSVTYEDYDDGILAINILYGKLKDINGLVGRIKIERTTRLYRKPANAPALPLITKQAFQDWLYEGRS